MGAPGFVTFCVGGHAYDWTANGEIATYEEFPLRTVGSVIHACPCGRETWGTLSQYAGDFVDELGVFSLRDSEVLRWDVHTLVDFDEKARPVFEARRVVMNVPRYWLPRMTAEEHQSLVHQDLLARAGR